MAEKLKIAVIGVGHLGRNHARVFSELDEVELIGIMDTDPDRALSVANELGTKVISSTEGVDAVSIATPTISHFDIASEYIEKGVHVFVEKPMTKNLEQADKLVNLARKKNVILQVGHIERFNPVMIAMEPHIQNLRFIEAHRLGLFTPRSLDIGVVMDLMIHDIDLVLSMVPSPVKSVSAMGVRLITPYEDLANARIIFENGCTANVTASRISFKQMRQMRLFQDNMYISVDFRDRQAKVYKKAPDFMKHVAKLMALKANQPGISAANFAHEMFSELVMLEDLKVVEHEPLKAELKDFVRCVNTGERPKVNGEDGLNAIRVANMIVAEIEKSLASPSGGAVK